MKKQVFWIVLLQVCLFSTTAFADRSGNRDYFDNGRHYGFSARDRDRDRRASFRRDRNSDISVNGIIGAPRTRYYNPGYNSIFNTFGYGVGYSSFGGQYYLNHGLGSVYPSWTTRAGPPLIIERNTYIEVPSRNRSASTVRNRQSGTSLLRDITGRCFERYIDSDGYETRIELDAAECNF
jgi:hypothetical protein